MYTRRTHETRPSQATVPITAFNTSCLKVVFPDQAILFKIPTLGLHICLLGDMPDVTCCRHVATLASNDVSLLKRKVMPVPIGNWKMFSWCCCVSAMQFNSYELRTTSRAKLKSEFGQTHNVTGRYQIKSLSFFLRPTTKPFSPPALGRTMPHRTVPRPSSPYVFDARSWPRVHVVNCHLHSSPPWFQILYRLSLISKYMKY